MFNKEDKEELKVVAVFGNSTLSKSHGNSSTNGELLLSFGNENPLLFVFIIFNIMFSFIFYLLNSGYSY